MTTRRTLALAAVLLPLLWSAAPTTAQAQSRYTVSTDGTEVTDSRTRLVWRRCAEGQAWDGSTCSGTAATYTHEQALAHASTQTGWRLPNVKELASLVDRSRSFPAIDTAAFPAMPPSLFWSSSPLVGGAYNAWYVLFDDGSVYYNSRDGDGLVRLVRLAAGS